MRSIVNNLLLLFRIICLFLRLFCLSLLRDFYFFFRWNALCHHWRDISICNYIVTFELTLALRSSSSFQKLSGIGLIGNRYRNIKARIMVLMNLLWSNHLILVHWVSTLNSYHSSCRLKLWYTILREVRSRHLLFYDSGRWMKFRLRD